MNWSGNLTSLCFGRGSCIWSENRRSGKRRSGKWRSGKWRSGKKRSAKSDLMSSLFLLIWIEITDRQLIKTFVKNLRLDSCFFWSPLVRRHLFWPPSMVYNSIIIKHILHITNHAGPSVRRAIHVLHSGHFFSSPPYFLNWISLSWNWLPSDLWERD